MGDSRPIDDLDEARRLQTTARNRGLRSVFSLIAVVMVAQGAANVWAKPSWDLGAVSAFATGFVALWFRVMVGRQSSERTLGTLVAVVLVMAAWALYDYGSVRAASSFAIIGALVLAGAFLSLRAVIASVIAGAGILGLLTWAEQRQLLAQPDFLPNLLYWLIGASLMVVIGVLLHYVRRSIDEAQVARGYQVEDLLRLESERDRSLRRFDRVFQLNPTAQLISTAHTQAVLEVNAAFERDLGHAAVATVGQPLASLWTSASEAGEHFKRLFEQLSTGWQPCQWQRADGSPVDVWVHSELSDDPSGALVLTTVSREPLNMPLPQPLEAPQG